MPKPVEVQAQVDDSAVMRALTRFRRSARAKMLRTLDELLEVAKKNAVSRYTRRENRARWVQLAGRLIWYRDGILKNYGLEAIRLELDDLQRLVDKRNAEEAAKPMITTMPPPNPEETKKRLEAILRQQNMGTGAELEPSPFMDDEKEDATVDD